MLKNPTANLAKEAIFTAGKLILRSLDRIDRVMLQQTAQNTWITDVEIQTAEVLHAALSRAYPKYGFMSEVVVQEPKGSPYTWFVDALCSTENYTRSLMHSALSIALCKNNILETAVIYDPIRQELFSATKGQGAFLNNRRIRVSGCKKLTETLLGIYSKEATLTTFSPPDPVQSLRASGSLALDLAYVAAGRLDAVHATTLTQFYPWEILPGMLLIQEAGGFLNIQEDCVLKENPISQLFSASPGLYKLLFSARCQKS